MTEFSPPSPPVPPFPPPHTPRASRIDMKPAKHQGMGSPAFDGQGGQPFGTPVQNSGATPLGGPTGNYANGGGGGGQGVVNGGGDDGDGAGGFTAIQRKVMRED